MMCQALRFLCYSNLYLTATAWVAGLNVGVAGGVGGINGRGNNIQLHVTASAAESTAMDVDIANENVESDGECGVTPSIPATNTANQQSSTVPSSSSTFLTRKPSTGDIVTFTLLKFQPYNPPNSEIGDGEEVTGSSSNENSLTTNNSNDPLVLEPLFDTTGTLQLSLNNGNYLPGLHQLLSTMSPGEVVRGVKLDAGYGGWKEELEFRVDIDQLRGGMDVDLVKVGTTLRMGNGMECRVTKIVQGDKGQEGKGGYWVCDANQPLAGSQYEVDVKLESVEEGPKFWEYVGDDDERIAEYREQRYRVATFALGCFWGGELAYQRMPGVITTSVGYTQGTTPNPTYQQVCTGTTGHTEAIRIVYDPNVVTYKSLVELGMERLGQDVYKLNQVGNDRGTQYRHGVYYHDEEQRGVAEEILRRYGELNLEEGSDAGDGKSIAMSERRNVMTELEEAQVFYLAEDYHQQYLLKGGQSAKKGAQESIRCYG